MELTYYNLDQLKQINRSPKTSSTVIYQQRSRIYQSYFLERHRRQANDRQAKTQLKKKDFGKVEIDECLRRVSIS